MRWIQAGAKGTGERAVRLAYCTNLHPARDAAELVRWLREVAVPLRKRLGAKSEFGVGLYLPAELAARLARDPSAARALARELQSLGLDAFTFNAFPYGEFGQAGLKERVFAPAWGEPEREQFTLDVARVAVGVAGAGARASHVSISTHTGAHQSALGETGARARCAGGLARAARELAALARASGLRFVLALEPEPRSLCNDLAGLGPWLAEVGTGLEPAAWAVLGACLDACHAAVEFEQPRPALLGVTGRAPLGKLQFTSALRLDRPGANPAGLASLLALDEPRYLHQATARVGSDLLRAGDLAELSRELERDPRWRSASELRVHFHVPVHLEQVEGLGTTREVADELLREALAAPQRWGTRELHVEIETYTWDILPRSARQAGELVDGLLREYAHVAEQLARQGYRPG
jgi:sugar phosphate isomerase/epimerase